jgi:hypothetical protein
VKIAMAGPEWEDDPNFLTPPWGLLDEEGRMAKDTPNIQRGDVLLVVGKADVPADVGGLLNLVKVIHAPSGRSGYLERGLVTFGAT